jgi:hypothetical protein
LDNIKVIKTGINVSKIVRQLEMYPQDWGMQKRVDGAQSMLDRGFPEIEAGVLQLVMGGIEHEGQYVGDTEICIPTEACRRHTEIISFLKRNFKRFSRCGFLSLPVGGSVGKHIDFGKYKYMVGDEEYVVEPGTLLWFNNKLPHGTENVGDCIRITFVFDVPHHKNNPK